MREGERLFRVVYRCPRRGVLVKLSKQLGVHAYQLLCVKHTERLVQFGYTCEQVQPLEGMAVGLALEGQCEVNGRFMVYEGKHDNAQSAIVEEAANPPAA